MGPDWRQGGQGLGMEEKGWAERIGVGEMELLRLWGAREEKKRGHLTYPASW